MIMRYKKFGNTGKDISVVGFGGMRFPSTDGTYHSDQCIGMIRKARELGINYFDTAPGYNDDQSEILFGHAFREMDAPFYVSTKSMATDGKVLRKNLERSLTRLNREAIDFYHIWCVMNLDDYRLRIRQGGALAACIKAKKEGLIRHICISTHCNDQEIKEILANDLFEGITVGYNILNFRYRYEGIRMAYEKGLGVVTMNPLAGGLLTRNPDCFSHLVEGHRNIIEAAIQFNLSHPEITCVLTGMDSLEHVILNASIPNEISRFTPESLPKFRETAAEGHNDFCTGCRYCEPCPHGIEISKYMQAYNVRILSSPQDLKNNLRYHWRIRAEELDQCNACGLCEKRCTQHLPITDRIQDILSLHGTG